MAKLKDTFTTVDGKGLVISLSKKEIADMVASLVTQLAVPGSDLAGIDVKKNGKIKLRLTFMYNKNPLYDSEE